MKLISKIKVL